jgi:dCTP deaminase
MLSDLQIFVRLVRPSSTSRIIIAPLISLKNQLGASSLDVHVGYEFRVFRYQQITHLEPLDDEDTVQKQLLQYTEQIEIDPNPNFGKFILHPGEFALASTIEFVGLPSDVAAILEGRSSYARLGLEVHAAAGYIAPGFRGTVTFEMANIGHLPIPLYVGLRIAQLTFWEVGTPAIAPYGRGGAPKYQQQLGTRPSSFYKDPELRRLRESVRQQRLRQAEAIAMEQAQRNKRPHGGLRSK